MRGWTNILGMILAAMALAGCQEKVDLLADAVPIAPQLTIYEGLPHQHWESELLAAELKTASTTQLHGYPFYEQPLAISEEDQAAIIAALRNRRMKTPAIAGTAKSCGGFHPDYAVCWSADGQKNCVLVCIGCREIEHYRNDATADRYDLRSAQLLEPLSKYRQSRPETKRVQANWDDAMK